MTAYNKEDAKNNIRLAVNKSAIHRYLSKPIKTGAFIREIEQAINSYLEILLAVNDLPLQSNLLRNHFSNSCQLWANYLIETEQAMRAAQYGFDYIYARYTDWGQKIMEETSYKVFCEFMVTTMESVMGTFEFKFREQDKTWVFRDPRDLDDKAQSARQ